jgi:membrane associated rhomboid family serine protease
MLTIIIIAITSIISIQAFRNHQLMDRLIFYPPSVKRGEWYRLFSYGVLHADTMHLIFNMFTLYMFGSQIELIFRAFFGNITGGILYILLYVTALLVSILPTYLKQQHNTYYSGLGASGAVSAIVFAYILIMPMNFMGILFIPIWLPAFLFGGIFILISMNLNQKQVGGINHSAHITGGIFGMLFTMAAFIAILHINLVSAFFSQIQINSIDDIIRFGWNF